MFVTRTAEIKGSLLLEFIDEATGHKRWKKIKNNTTDNLRAAIASATIGSTSGIPSHISVGTGAIASLAHTNRDSSITMTGNANGTVRQISAQWIPASTYPYYVVQDVLLYLTRVGTDSSNLWIEIQTNSAGVPSGTPVTNGTSDLVPFNLLSTLGGWIQFHWTTQPTLDPGTTYHLVLKTDQATYSAGVTAPSLSLDSSSPSSPLDPVKNYNGTSWIANTGEMVVRIIPKVDPSFTSVLGELTRVAISGKSKPSANIARLLGSFAPGVASDFIGVAGLHDAAASGNLLAIANLVWEKSTTTRLNIYWLLEIN